MKILLSKNLQIISKYLKTNSIIGFIPTASEVEENKDYMYNDIKLLEDMGYSLINIDISNSTTEDILSLFKKVDALFVAGGNCFYLLQQLKLKGVLKEVIDFANNKIYIGSSAGSCIACPNIEYVAKLDDKNLAPRLKEYNAMNLINGYILPHYLSKKKYTELSNEIMLDYPNLKFIPLRNNQAIIANSRTDYRIVDSE